mgnify:CR=1 FL=1
MKSWFLTQWSLNSTGGWLMQPVIIVDGESPFIADTPQGYIDKLQSLHDREDIQRGTFYTFAGQLKDCLDQSWGVAVP